MAAFLSSFPAPLSPLCCCMPFSAFFPRRASLLAGLAALALLPACAKVTFHTDPQLKHKTGLKFYTSKPYLLVSYTGNKDTPIKIDNISLPDLQNPTYAVYHSGWGTHEFTMGVNANGTLSTYGQKADSKGPETMTALGNLLSSAGSGLNSAATGLNTLHKQSANYDAATQAVRAANASLADISLKSANELKPYTALQTVATSTVQTLGKVAQDLTKDPQAQIAPLERARSALTGVQIPDTGVVLKTPADMKMAADLKAAVDKAVSFINSALQTLKNPDAEPPPAARPDFKLFEILIEDGATVLREVRMEPAQLRALKAAYAK
ncbi:MAG: hypothetical protein B7Z37_21130 [Verrucomicrobia bacterium 12-59-8]|nr:MAG: hypothetical protein B7Z37_21130 [Verrucomicrobia bacterium 12-59-8]